MTEARQEPGRLDIYCQQGHRVRLRFTAPVGFPDDFTAAGTVIRRRRVAAYLVGPVASKEGESAAQAARKAAQDKARAEINL